jgi:hypothetical protein
MFGWIFGSLSSKIWGAIDGALKKQFGKFIRLLQGLKSGGVKALAATVADSAVFQAANIPGQWMTDRITEISTRDFVDFMAIPFPALEVNPAISLALAKRLADENEVKAWVTELNMTPNDLSQVLAAYSSSLVKFGMRSALERLHEGETPLYANYVVFGVEDGDAYQIGSDTRHRTMVRFVSASKSKQAEKFWKRRDNPKFKFEKNVYQQ